MRLTVIIRTLGMLFLLFSTTLLPPIGISFFYDESEIRHFSLTFAIALLAGVVLWLPFRHDSDVIRSRDGFLIVALMWTAMSLLGTVPFMLSLDLSFADAFFESVSGFTTTGATVLQGLDEMSKSMLFYRQELNWLGGIGVMSQLEAEAPFRAAAVVGRGGLPR